MALPAPKDRYTFADCLTWGEDERIEIINGEAIMMAPAHTYSPGDQRGIIPAACKLPGGKEVQGIRRPLRCPSVREGRGYPG